MFADDFARLSQLLTLLKPAALYMSVARSKLRMSGLLASSWPRNSEGQSGRGRLWCLRSLDLHSGNVWKIICTEWTNELEGGSVEKLLDRERH